MNNSMQKYVGVKLVKATPMNRQAYNDYRGWTLPDDEDGTDEGYLVEYLDGGQSNHPDHAGYVSWSPAGVFNRSYRPTDDMTFGMAIEAMKDGEKVCRTGWNGKGMWIALTPGSSFQSIHAKDGHAAKHRADEMDEGGTVIHLLPHIDMRTADGSMCVGWLASQTDMLAEDWCIAEGST